jgi:hypothetical protein
MAQGANVEVDAILFESEGPPASASEFARIMKTLGVSPPGDYQAFMLQRDGATGFVGRAYLVVYSMEQLTTLNRLPWESHPWLVHFGSNGSGRSYAFDTRPIPNHIVAIDMIGREEEESMGATLSEFLAHIGVEASMWLHDDVLALAGSMHSSGAASDDDVRLFQQLAGDASVPSDFVQFAVLADGAEGFVGDRYLALWRLGDIPELNAVARVQQFAPGLVLVGTDGGTTAIGLDTRPAVAVFVTVPLVGLFWSRAQRVGSTFDSLLRSLSGGALSPKHELDPSRLGMNVWEIQPLVLGGSPTDTKNKAMAPLRQCLAVSAFWNEQIAAATGGSGG